MDVTLNVYDYFCPSPLSLRQLSSMEVASSLWRVEIQRNVTKNGILRERYPRKRASLLHLSEEVPSTVLSTIDSYVCDLQFEIPLWLHHHSSKGILKLDVLTYFHDFVLDFDGSIHYARTAKRFLTCEGIDDVVKFKMACLYCFEDDVLSIWSRVSSRFTANKANLTFEPLSSYWLNRLTNEPPDTFVDDAYSLQVLCTDYNCREWSSAKYFFDRVPPHIRMTYFKYLLGPRPVHEIKNIFYRYMLTKLSDEELKMLVNENGAELVLYSWHPYNLQIWADIKNQFTDHQFDRLVKYFVTDESDNLAPSWHPSDYRQIWTSAPNHLKEGVLRDALLDVDRYFFDRNSNFNIPNTRRSLSFILTVLSEIPIEGRQSFWKIFWETMYVDVRPADFHNLINVCFDGDQNQITRFKTQIMSSHYRQKIHPRLKELLESGYLEELEEFLRFWCSNTVVVKEVRRNLLYDNFVISTELVGAARQLNEFIENAFEDEVVATDFKDRLFHLPELKTMRSLKRCARAFQFYSVMEFVDIFAPDDVMYEIRQCVFIPLLWSSLHEARGTRIRRDQFLACPAFLDLDFDVFIQFVNWLFESDVEIAQFKRELNMDVIVQRWVEGQKSRLDTQSLGYLKDWFASCFETLDVLNDDSVLKKFLKWYFVAPEDAAEFETKYSYDYIFNRLLYN